MNLSESDARQSTLFKAMRFPLIVMVLYVHSSGVSRHLLDCDLLVLFLQRIPVLLEPERRRIWEGLDLPEMEKTNPLDPDPLSPVEYIDGFMRVLKEQTI